MKRKASKNAGDAAGQRRRSAKKAAGGVMDVPTAVTVVREPIPNTGNGVRALDDTRRVRGVEHEDGIPTHVMYGGRNADFPQAVNKLRQPDAVRKMAAAFGITYREGAEMAWIDVDYLLGAVKSATAWSADAVLRDITASRRFTLLAKEGGGGTFLGGSDAQFSLVFSKMEVEDRAVVTRVRELYQNALLIPGLFTGMGRLRSDHTVFMSGNSLILTDQCAFVEGYRNAKKGADACVLDRTLYKRTLDELADTVWGVVVAELPFLKKYRDQYFTAFAQAFLLGDEAAANLIAITLNQPVALHLDTKDAPYAIVLWLHGGTGTIEGGLFRVPALGVELMPLEFTVVVLATSLVPHGTDKPVCSGTVVWLGSSQFVRLPDLRNLHWLRRGLEVQKRSAEEMEACVREEVVLATQGSAGQIRAKYAGVRRRAMQQGRRQGSDVVAEKSVHNGLVGWRSRRAVAGQ